MAGHGWGIWLPNEGDPEIGRAIDIVGNGCYTILDHQAGKDGGVERIRRECPDAYILVRFYLKNWYTTDPAQHARRIRDTMFGPQGLARFTRSVTWANEQNLADESEGAVGASISREASWADYQKIAAWNTRVLDELAKFPECAQLILHYPAMAYGHGEDWARDGGFNPIPGYPTMSNGDPTPAYSLLAEGINRCHVLNVHPYTQAGADNGDAWRGCERVEKVHALFPHKTLFVAETGQFDITNPKAPDQIVNIGYRMQSKRYVVGWTPFLLNSPDPGHAVNNWSRNGEVEIAYKRTTRIDRPNAGVPTPGQGIVLPSAPKPTPKPEQPVIKFTLGFLDFSNKRPAVVGSPLSNETNWFDGGEYVGQQQKTSNGRLVWYKASNQKFFLGNDGKAWAWNNGNPVAVG